VQIAASGARTVVRLDPCAAGSNAGAADSDADGVLDACERARGDFDLDGEVGSADLSALLALWGAVRPPFGDLTGDRVVDSADIAALLSNWGPY
jgi:hypothetical protein